MGVRIMPVSYCDLAKFFACLSRSAHKDLASMAIKLQTYTDSAPL